MFRPDFVGGSNSSGSPLPPGHSVSRSAHDDVEVHTENTDSWVVLDTEIDVLLDTETEVTGGGKVPDELATRRASAGCECASTTKASDRASGRGSGAEAMSRDQMKSD